MLIGLTQQRLFARRLKKEIMTLYLAARDPRTPWYAKALGVFVVAYALSPIDLIPDFIPVLGYLDDVILLPLFIALKLLILALCIALGLIIRVKLSPLASPIAEMNDLYVNKARQVIVEKLKEMGAFDNTLIFFASDNGASAEIMVRNGGHDQQAAPGSAETYLCLGPGFSSACNTPHRRHKTWVHEGGISTPLIAHWPAGITAKNELRHTPAHVIDIVPTVLDLAGIQKPKEWKGEPIPEAPGRSLVRAFSKDETIARESLWWLHESNKAIRIGDWKLVAAKGDPWELYDLRTDRAEQHNLAAKMPDKVTELDHAWQRQADSFTELAKKTLADQPKGKGGKGKGKSQD